MVRSQRPRFRDAQLDLILEDLGFVVLRGAGVDLIRPARRLHRQVAGSVPPGFHSTMYSSDDTAKRRVNEGLTSLFTPLLDRLFVGHRPLLSSFVTKGRGAEGTMPPHQDWTFVDEPGGSSFNVWVPLVDVDQRNGAMLLLPRGHRLPRTIRGTDTTNPFERIEHLVVPRMVSLDMHAGDVLVHDHRVLHGSPPNARRRPRIVAGCAVVPQGAEVVHYRSVAPGRLDRYQVEDRFFTDHTYGAAALPPSARPTGAVEFANPVFEAGDLEALDALGSGAPDRRC